MRTQELIKIGEDLLLTTEAQFSKFGVVSVKLVKEADTKASAHATTFLPKLLYSYGQVFPAIFCLILASAICALVYAIYLNQWLDWHNL